MRGSEGKDNGKVYIRVNFSKLGNIQKKRSQPDATRLTLTRIQRSAIFCPIPQLYFARIFDEERPFDILLIVIIIIIIIINIIVIIIIIFSHVNERNT